MRPLICVHDSGDITSLVNDLGGALPVWDILEHLLWAETAM